MSTLQLQDISKRFKDVDAVRDVNLTVGSGEFFSILGPSGCGKTTLLRLIAGFESVSTGKILISGNDVTNVPPQSRGIGMVFQNYALFPHMTVYGNVAFGLETKGFPLREVQARVEKILDAVELSGKKDVPVTILSGGEQQRVAVARALVVEPAILLMDEPLSNLDVALRHQTREEIRILQRRIGITTVYVTHDQSEAMSLSDRIAVMKDGEIVQIGTPAEIYELPGSAFVAAFLGGANILEGSLDAESLIFHTNGLDIPVPAALAAGQTSRDRSLVVKPEAINIQSGPAGGGLRGKIVHKEYLGYTTNCVIRISGLTLHATATTASLPSDLTPGDDVSVSFDWKRCILLSNR